MKPSPSLTLPKHRIALSLAASLALLSTLFWGISSTQARSPQAPCPVVDPFTVTSVQPSEVSNAAQTTLVVTGTGFCDGVTVVIEGFGGLETTLVNGNLLNATLPAGVPAREYRVQVINGDGADLGDSPPSITVHGPAATARPTETNTITPSPVPTGTAGPTAYVRPSINVDSYDESRAIIVPGRDFDFEITLVNRGQTPALEVTAEFVAGDITPRDTGGVRTHTALAPGETWKYSQPLRASDTLWGLDTATVQVNVDYFDTNGQSYSDSFTLTFQVALLGNTATPSPTPTASQTPAVTPRLLINGYDSGGQTIGPGDQFDLQLQIQNVGRGTAKGVTMIFDGSQGSSSTGGTPGANGDFGDFAPQDGSNLRFVGDVATGQSTTVTQTLVVNGSAASGAYPLQFSFVYTDEYGVSHTDEQVITVLVVAAPRLEISYYEEPEPFVVGESNLLPLQVVNQGLNSVVLGSMRVDGSNARYSNNAILIGTLDQGSYFTLDAVVVPEEPGTLEFTVTIDYTDAFNRVQQITQTMQVEVAGPTVVPGAETGGAGQPNAESGGFMQTVWRAVLGFFGFGGG